MLPIETAVTWVIKKIIYLSILIFECEHLYKSLQKCSIVCGSLTEESVSKLGKRIEIKKFAEMDSNDNDESKDRLKVINSYFDIVDAFNLFKNVFQVMMLFHTVETFMHDLIYVEMMIQFTDPASVSALTAWMVKNFTLQAIVSIQCEIYYHAVCNAQSTCVLFMRSKRCSAEERRICKNIIREHAAVYSPLCACALYRVDARLPLRLLGLVATYTVVLLQFAFM
ncbi:hypothetical protein ABMA27_009191 [Loxostege sticticalis]|uniref:Uncharacterized protein n=1 Tax=Loxostege sticticalis TaxID=481309 RepID=A0ABR3HA89_LOXSC